MADSLNHPSRFPLDETVVGSGLCPSWMSGAILVVGSAAVLPDGFVSALGTGRGVLGSVPRVVVLVGPRLEGAARGPGTGQSQEPGFLESELQNRNQDPQPVAQTTCIVCSMWEVKRQTVAG